MTERSTRFTDNADDDFGLPRRAKGHGLPAVGRMVWFTEDSGSPVAGIVSWVYDDEETCDLRLMKRDDAPPPLVEQVPFSNQPKPGTWRWPPR